MPSIISAFVFWQPGSKPFVTSSAVFTNKAELRRRDLHNRNSRGDRIEFMMLLCKPGDAWRRTLQQEAE